MDRHPHVTSCLHHNHHNHHHHHQAQTGCANFVFLCCTMMADPSGRPQSSGVARRRRERRLRSMLRHERMTVAMALAESTHHSSRGQDGQGRGVGARAELHGEDPEAPHTPAGALQPRRRARRGACQHLCLRSLAGRTRWCGTSWKISAPSARSCRSSIFLCRR